MNLTADSTIQPQIGQSSLVSRTKGFEGMNLSNLVLFGEQQRCKTDVHADVDHTDGAIAFEIVRILEE